MCIINVHHLKYVIISQSIIGCQCTQNCVIHINISPVKRSLCFRNSGKNASLKAPTTILIKPDGKTLEAFGYEAEDRYRELVEDNEHHGYYYFKRFKMMLHGKEVYKHV